MAGEGPPADVGAGDAAEALAELDAGADPKPPKPAVPGEGAETVAGVGVPEAVAGVDHHEAELDAGAVPRPLKPDGRGGEAEALAGVGVPRTWPAWTPPKPSLTQGPKP